MYKLHYDVNAGEQLSIGYKGVEFEIQAGTGGGGSDVEIEENKQVTITENGTLEITPSIDKDAMSKVTATVNVPVPRVEPFQYVTITQNWTDTSIGASDGYDVLGSANVHVDIPTESKEVSITENGHYDIEPSDEYQVMDSVSVDVNVPTKSVQVRTTTTITSNGIHYIYPDTGYDGTAYVKALVQVPTSGVDVESNKTVTITENGTVEITPSIDKDAMAKVTATVNVPTSGVPLENAVFYSTAIPSTLSPIPNAQYMYTGTTAKTLLLDFDGYDGDRWSGVRIFGDNLTVSFLSTSYTSEFGYITLPNAILSGVYYTKPVHSIKVMGNCSINGTCYFGAVKDYNTNQNPTTEVEFHGAVDAHNSEIQLRNCNLYFYTNDIRNLTRLNNFDNLKEWGEVHVLRTFEGNTLGGHSVYKDLTS